MHVLALCVCVFSVTFYIATVASTTVISSGLPPVAQKMKKKMIRISILQLVSTTKKDNRKGKFTSGIYIVSSCVHRKW